MMDILKIRKKAQAAKAARQDSEVEKPSATPAAPAEGGTDSSAPHASSPAPTTISDSVTKGEKASIVDVEPLSKMSARPPGGAASIGPEVVALPPVAQVKSEPLAAEGIVKPAELQMHQDALTAKFESSRVALRDDDPLGEFLAYYDEKTPDVDVALDDPELEKSGRRYLAFHLAHEAYAVSILDVREILKTYAVTRVPRAAPSVLGVLSKRGVVIPMVDVAAAMGLRDINQKMRPHQRILVIGDGEEVMGLRVDSVSSVVRIGSANVEPVPGGLGPRSAHLLSGLGRDGDDLYILLDVVAFLGHLYGAIDVNEKASSSSAPEEAVTT